MAGKNITFGTQKAQGATEYLVIMSVVLGIALICVAILVWPTGTTKDAKKSQTDTKFKIAAMQYPDLMQGMVAYYKFDEASGSNAADNKGGATASLSGNTWPSGKSNTALGLAGSGGGSTGSSFSFPSALTMMMWVKPTTSGYLAHIGSYTPAAAGFEFLSYDGSSLNVLYSDGGYASAGYTYTLPTTTWTQVAVTHAFNGSIKFYINGTLAKTVAGSTTTMGISGESLSIGRFHNGAGVFNGAIDELILFNRVLSDGEIQLLYENPGYPQ